MSWDQAAGPSSSMPINTKQRASMFVKGLGARGPGGPQTGSRLFTTGGALPKQQEHWTARAAVACSYEQPRFTA